MSITADRPPADERRPMKVTLFALNLVALAALVVPTFLILESLQLTVGFEPDILVAVIVLFAVGVAACAGSMLLMARPRSASSIQTLSLLLPVAGLSLMGAFGILAAFSF